MDAYGIPTGPQIAAWVSSVVVALGAAMTIRRRGSTDAKERAKDAAETNYFATAIDDMKSAMGDLKADRDQWRQRAFETDALLAKANETIARMTALHEAREADVAELRALNKQLRDLVVRLSPKDLRDLLAESLSAIPSKPQP